jgi:DNA-binding transcriptional LysR family regulator
MEIYQLRAFVTVARLGHLTRAAEALHLTQPAVSGQIKALEEELGLALFDRRPGRIALTRAGERLAVDAEHVLVAAGALTGLAQTLKGEVTGSMVLGTVGDADSLRLGSLLGGLVQALPLLDIKTRADHAENLREAVAAGTLNASFYIGPNIPREVLGLALQTLHYRIAAPAALRERVLHAGWREMADMPWVGSSPASHHHHLLRDLFVRQGLLPNVVLEADDTASPLPLVRAGVGLTLLREDVAMPAAERNEVVLWPHVRVAAQLSFVYARTAAQDPGVLGALSVLKRVWSLPA